ncbi:MAG: SagB/ThcOx family dehydrogenase [Anaerolineales bacterium]
MMSETNNREFMKSDFAESVHQRSDQAKGVSFPPLQKEIPEGASISIDVPDPDPGLIQKKDYFQLIQDRQSWRQYSEESLSLEELSYLLFCTQGVIAEIGEGYASRRPVPSAGARHPYETYLAINRVEGLEPGLYRYLPFDQQLLLLETTDNLLGLLAKAALGQRFVGQSAVVFAWSCIPYRAEWRYMDHAHKNMLLDAGHICQNLYLAAESIGAGTCAVGAYDQAAFDTLFDLDGEDEYLVYLAPVGKI